MSRNYFSYFPNIQYDIDGSGIKRTVKDILRRVVFRDNIKKNASLFLEYSVEDTDTPESVAYRVYGSASYHWIILLLNEMTNPFFDWPLKQLEFENFMAEKYAGSAIYFRTPYGGVFLPDDTVTWPNGTTGSATVIKWSPTLRELIVDDITGTIVGSAGSSSSHIMKDANDYGYVGRFVSDYQFGLNRFTVDGEPGSSLVVPYWAVVDEDAETTTYNRTVSISSNYLTSYIASDSEIDGRVVTNLAYEEYLNNEKRKIKVLREEFVPLVTKEIQNLLK